MTTTEQQTSEPSNAESLPAATPRVHLSPHGQTRAEVEQVAATIATEFAETNTNAIWVLRRLVYLFGPAWAEEHVAKTRAAEEAGGILVPTGLRRRTPGGVFFFLARQTVGDETWAEKVDNLPKRKPRTPKEPRPPEASPPAPTPPKAKAKPKGQEKSGPVQSGEARGIKIRFAGRPGPIEVSDGYVTTMFHTAKVPSVPKGLPLPRTTVTRYKVIIGKRQWARVEAALADPKVTLAIEGYPTLDVAPGTVAVYALEARALVPETPEQAARNLPVGEVRPVKAKMSGRPGKIENGPEHVVLLVENRIPPSLPREMPRPVAQVTQYRVFIGKKQWARVERPIQSDPADVFVVEGGFVLDAKAGVIEVHALDVKSALIERAGQEAREKIEAEASVILARARARSAAP